MQQPGTARQHYDKALTLYSLESDSSAVYRVEIDLGDLLLDQGQLDAAELHLLKALAGSNELKMDRRGHGYILANLGDVHLRRGELSEAETYLHQALEMAEAIPERIVMSNSRILLGKLNERQGNSALADTQFETAIRILEEMAMPDRLRDAHMEYAELLETREDVSSAYRHWKLAAEIGKMASLGVSWSPERESVAPSGVA
jgi:tetratricopeptide (TPR) repeat protein